MGTNEVISKNSNKKERSDAVTLIITKSQIYTLDIIILHSFDRPKFAAHTNSNTHTYFSSHTMVLKTSNVYQSNLSQPDVCFKITTHNQ